MADVAMTPCPVVIKVIVVPATAPVVKLFVPERSGLHVGVTPVVRYQSLGFPVNFAFALPAKNPPTARTNVPNPKIICFLFIKMVLIFTPTLLKVFGKSLPKKFSDGRR